LVTGEFGQSFIQKVGNSKTGGFLTGNVVEGSAGMKFIPSGEGIKLSTVNAELKSFKGFAADFLGVERRQSLSQLQSF